MLGQTEIISYLERCNGDKESIEEILSAYIAWKVYKGRSSAHILEKLRSLTLYMKVTGRGHILNNARDIFVLLASEVALGGQSRIGVLPANTALGRETANRIRAAASSSRRRGVAVSTDGVYGGPMPVQAFMASEEQRRPAVHVPLSSPTATGIHPTTPPAGGSAGAGGWPWSVGAGAGAGAGGGAASPPVQARSGASTPQPPRETSPALRTPPIPGVASPASPTSPTGADPLTINTNVFNDSTASPLRSPWAERYFRRRRQFGNEGVPAYTPPLFEDEDARGGLPEYHPMVPSYHSASVHSHHSSRHSASSIAVN